MGLRARRRTQLAQSKTPLDQSRERLRLFIAAAAVFVLILGLTFLMYMMLVKEMAPTAALAAFLPFFLVGLLFFVASAFISSKAAQPFINFFSRGGQGSGS